MKTIYVVLAVFSFGLFSSFKTTEACAYAESNMGYVMSQTQKAIEQNDINKARLFAYRAINALEKSKEQFKDCGCDYAAVSISENSENLKMATKTNSLGNAKILLNKSLENTLESIEALEEHDSHNNSKYASNMLAMNTKTVEKEELILKIPVKKSLYTVVDQSLIKYETSLNKIVNTVNCKEARAFATKIYSHCEQQLLMPNLTEGKKYYNLRTKEITAKALKAIGECETK